MFLWTLGFKDPEHKRDPQAKSSLGELSLVGSRARKLAYIYFDLFAMKTEMQVT